MNNTNFVKILKGIVTYVLTFLFLLLFINTYFVSVTEISGESMYPTFSTGEKILFTKFSSFSPVQSYKQGDIVVCRFGNTSYNKDNTTEQDNTSTYVKRIIAVGGDTIEITDGKVFVNNIDITEKYWGDTYVNDNLLQIKIPKGYVFVIGDNINNSKDSRVIKSIPYSNILGEVVYKIPSFERVK